MFGFQLTQQFYCGTPINGDRRHRLVKGINREHFQMLGLHCLYSFLGLRAYKDKFAPLWVPRFIAGPRGIGLARSLIDLQTLISGNRASAARHRRAQH